MARGKVVVVVDGVMVVVVMVALEMAGEVGVAGEEMVEALVGEEMAAGGG